MLTAMRHYLVELVEDFGTGWNRFWFTPCGAETLSVVRILLGCLALFWIATWTPDLQRFFGPSAILSPSKMVLFGDLPETILSYFNLLTTPGAVFAGHLIGIAIVILFTLGIATRATSILATLVVLSYIDRGSLLTSSFEAVLAMLMIYLCIGVSGTYWSVDALWRKRRANNSHGNPPDRVPSLSVWNNLATRLIQVHLSLIYFLMVVAKLRSSDWLAGQAVGWLWSRPGEHRWINLATLLDYPYLVNFVTLAILLVELAFVVFVWTPRTRPLMLGLSACVWLLLALTTGLTAFCLLMLVANLVFVSPRTMQVVCRSHKESRSEAIA